MSKKFLVVGLGVGIVLGVIALKAEAAELKLNSKDGTTKFTVQDSDTQEVFSVDSAGNVIVKETMTVEGTSFSVSAATFTIKNGNVGIGTAGPGSRLAVSGGATFGSGYAATAVADGNVAISGNVGIGTAGPTSKLGVLGNLAVGGTYGSLAAPTGGMIIEGNVGIGITLPSVTLHVKGPLSSENGIRVDSVDGSGTNIPYPGSIINATLLNYRGLNVTVDGVTLSNPPTAGLGIAVNRSEPAVSIRNNSGPGLVIESGNVGIGTTSPGIKLEINSGSSQQIASFLSTNANYNEIFIGKSVENDSNLVVGYNPASNYGYLHIYDVSPGTGLVIADEGNVGIGTTSPGGSTTVGTKVLSIADGTDPVGGVAGQVSLYSSSGELWVLDAAGNTTLNSPHDKKTGEWIFYSKNTKTGKVLRVDMEKLVKFIDEKFGTDFVQEFTME